MLDGRHRLDGFEASGFEIKVESCGTEFHPQIRLFYRRARTDDMWMPIDTVELRGDRDVDPYGYVRSANIHRRHLTAADKRKVIAALIKANPQKSDRQISKLVKASPTTVGAERRKTCPSLDTSIDTQGRRQPRHKPATRKPATTKDPVVQAAADRAERRSEETKRQQRAAAVVPSGNDIDAQASAEQRKAAAVVGDVSTAVDTRTGTAKTLALQIIDAGYKTLARASHPDAGGSTDAMAQLNESRDLLKNCVGGNTQDLRRLVEFGEALRADAGADSAGELKRLRARVEELQRELHQRDLLVQCAEITIAGLRRRIAELEAAPPPDDDGLGIPASLRRDRAPGAAP